MLYERALMDKWDAYAVKKTAQDKLKSAMEAAKKSLKEGMKEGMKKGIEEGLEKGLEKGKVEGKADVVRNLISKFGFNDEQAADAAEVSIGFVKKIRASLKKKK